MILFSAEDPPTPQYCLNLQKVLRNSGIVITVLSCIAVTLNVGILAVYWKARRLLTPQYLAIINVVVRRLGHLDLG